MKNSRKNQHHKLKLQPIERIPAPQRYTSCNAVLATKHLPPVFDVDNRRNRKKIKLGNVYINLERRT